MKRLALFATLSLMIAFRALAQDTPPTQHPPEDTTSEWGDYPTEDDYQYHYEHGPWGYRAEAHLRDSLAIREMMGQMSSAEVRAAHEEFRRSKREKQRARQEALRRKQRE